MNSTTPDTIADNNRTIIAIGLQVQAIPPNALPSKYDDLKGVDPDEV